jgi:hypothetical protein
MEPIERGQPNVWGGDQPTPRPTPQRWEATPANREARSSGGTTGLTRTVTRRSAWAGPLLAAAIGLLVLLISLVSWDRPTDYREGPATSHGVAVLDRSPS